MGLNYPSRPTYSIHHPIFYCLFLFYYNIFGAAVIFQLSIATTNQQLIAFMHFDIFSCPLPSIKECSALLLLLWVIPAYLKSYYGGLCGFAVGCHGNEPWRRPQVFTITCTANQPPLPYPNDPQLTKPCCFSADNMQ